MSIVYIFSQERNTFEMYSGYKTWINNLVESVLNLTWSLPLRHGQLTQSTFPCKDCAHRRRAKRTVNKTNSSQTDVSNKMANQTLKLHQDHVRFICLDHNTNRVASKSFKDCTEQHPLSSDPPSQNPKSWQHCLSHVQQSRQRFIHPLHLLQISFVC